MFIRSFFPIKLEIVQKKYAKQYLSKIVSQQMYACDYQFKNLRLG